MAKTNCCSPNTSWTDWSPAWDPADHYTNESQKQTRSRCYNNTPEKGEQTLTGTKQPPCQSARCTPETKSCLDGSTIIGKTLSGTKKCDSNGNLSSECTGGEYTSSCPLPITCDCDCHNDENGCFQENNGVCKFIGYSEPPCHPQIPLNGTHEPCCT